MGLIGFKEWLSKDSPEGGGDIWNSHSNADFNNGLKSKNFSVDKSKKPFPNKKTPEKLFGISKNLN